VVDIIFYEPYNYSGGDVRRQAFLCGPEPMIEAVKKVLLKKGTKSENIFYDKF